MWRALPVRKSNGGPRADRGAPRPLSVALAAALGLAIGLALVRVTMRQRPAGMDAPESSDRGTTEPTRASVSAAPSSPHVAMDPMPPDEPSAFDERTGAVEGIPPTPAQNPTAPTVRDAPGLPVRSVLRGRVAYIRCGPATATRCPRDRDLEESVWAVLAELASCSTRPADPGTSDLRLLFRGDRREARFRAWGEAPLPDEALTTCVGSQLEALGTRLAVDPLLVSFQFRYE